MPQHQSIINKDLHKFVKYISPSSKDETRVWFLRYRDLDMRFASIGMGNVILPNKICIIHVRSLRERLTNVPPVMSIFRAFGKKPEPER